MSLCEEINSKKMKFINFSTRLRSNISVNLLCFLIIFIPLSGFQPEPKGGKQKIELDQLILMFIPDDDQRFLSDWKTGAYEGTPVTWITRGIELDERDFYREGEVVVTIDGQYSECLYQNVEPCRWSIRLQGPNTNGYSVFHIGSVIQPDFSPEETMEGLLKKLGGQAKLEKSCMITSGGFKLYHISLPGKKDFRMLFNWSCGFSACSLDFSCYFNEEDIPEEETICYD